MELLLERGEFGVRIAVTEADDGDVHPTRVDAAELAARQRDLTGQRWAMASQVHRADVWEVDQIRSPDRLAVADIVVLRRQRAATRPSALAMWAADCATAVFVTERALVGVHAGWRGLAAGVIQKAAAVAAERGDVESVVVGPVIGSCCYEFSEVDLRVVAEGTRVDVSKLRGVTTWGAPALDVGAATRAAFADAGVVPDIVVAGCTGCAGEGRRWFSHRARVDVERHALVGWFA